MQIDGKWYTIQAITDILFVKFSYLVSGYFNSSYQSAILVMVISRFVVIFGFYLFHRNRLNFIIDNSNRELSKDIIKFALPLVPITFLSWANSSVSQIVLKNMLGYADLGVYSIAVGLANTVNVVQAGFNAYWAPYVYTNYKSENNNFNQVHKYMIFLLLLISLIIVFCQDLIFIILGQKYRNAEIFFPFLLFSPICYTIAETTGLGINISKKTFWNLIIFSINITTNIVACLLLIPIFGVSGAAIASSISSILYLVIRTIVGEKYYKSIKSYRYLMYLLVILSSSALVNYFVYLKTLKYALFMLIFFIYAYLFRKEISSIFGALNRKA
jgi:O-antigen/teichoic acid export membrane protein